MPEAGAAAFLVAFIAFIAFTALGMVKGNELAKKPQTLETILKTQWSLSDIRAF